MTQIIGATPQLAFLNRMLSLFDAHQIEVPGDFKSRAYAVEGILDADISGLANTLLDFGINSGAVDFTIETSNKNLTKTLNSWLNNINKELRGKVPTGVKALAKQYYRERWKASSMIILRTSWEEVDGFNLPTKLWFVKGADVEISDNDETKTIGSEKYFLRVGDNKTIPLRSTDSEKIYVQKPYERWGSGYPTPYLIKKGVFQNLKFMELLTEKGSNVVGKALEYLLLMKKGDKELARSLNPEFIYTEEEMKQIKEDFSSLIRQMQSSSGVPMYNTHFDTTLEHLIPEYEKAIGAVLYAPIERRIMAGLGFIEVVEGITSTRKDAIINPKVFVSEVQSGVDDFQALLSDILMDIIESNKSLHRKFVNSEMIQFRTTPLKNFLSDEAKKLLVQAYDRGLVSKRTGIELGLNIDFDAEVERRKAEQEEGLDDNKYPFTMHPPIIQNQVTKDGEGNNDTNTLPDRKPGTPEAETKFKK